MDPPRWSLLSPAIIALAACVMIALERRYPYDRGQPFFRKGFFDDLVLYTLVQSFALGYVIRALVGWVDATVGAPEVRVLAGIPVAVQLALLVVLHDFYIYWAHRAQHCIPILWRTHEAHHSVEQVDWLAGSRSHPIEIFVNQTLELLPIALLTGSEDVALMKATLDAVWGMWIHSNIDVKSGRLQWFFNGPEMHRWHHAKEYVGHGSNYGTKLAIWDWMFGTARLPATKPSAYGLAERFPAGYLRQVVFAFRPLRGPSTPLLDCLRSEELTTNLDRERQR